jgi:hypothetical protein
VSDWHWEPHPDDLLDNLPPEARTELDQLAREIVVRDSMVYLDGSDYAGGFRRCRRGRWTPVGAEHEGGEDAEAGAVGGFGGGPDLT